MSEEAAECLRIESGRPRHGLDFGAETIPQEAGPQRAGREFTKGCYVGQETVARLHYKGKPNRTCGASLLSAPVEQGDAAITLAEREVGSIGSTAVSPVHGPIALALISRETAPGAEVAVGAAAQKAVVTDLPFSRLDRN